jgi:hypothetical protein
MAIIPAKNRGDAFEVKPASAFSRGDILMLTSASSLSGAPIAGGVDIAGIALADSTQSINGRVVYAPPSPDEIYWSSIVTGSAYTVGSAVTVCYSAASRWHVSTATHVGFAATVVKGTSELVQSGESRIQIQFVGNAGALLFS